MTGRTRFEKLVRDLIPAIIRKDGRIPVIRQLDDQTIRPFVAQKLLEEALEACQAMLFEGRDQVRLELADMLEVMERAAALSGISWDEIQATQRERRAARGGFQDNLVLSSTVPNAPRLFTGAQRPLLDALKSQLATCTRAHLAVSFVMRSGLELILPDLRAALDRGVQIRLVTTDYLGITEPEALDTLLSLTGNLQVRAYCEPQRSYHPKVYIFERPDARGVAFIGSSNLSRYALQTGIEWNYEVKALDTDWPLTELLSRYDELFGSEHSLPVTAEFVDQYRRERQPRSFVEAESLISQLEPPRPRKAQREALEQLERLREEGEHKGLVIAATGIGKTYLAAFDSQKFNRILFIAHREELLRQAHSTFEKVRPELRLGFYQGNQRDPQADVVFASVFTLGRPENLQPFAPDHFDYIVIDEVHHAAAKSYQLILDCFTPQFLLGLTATPYRGDNRDVFALCDGNVAYKLTFMEAIAFGWLVPFHYFGIFDTTDYELLPRRNGQYVEEALGRALASEARAKAILEAYQKHRTGPGLGFCVNIEHAKFMADYFQQHGVPALAVYSGKGAPDRQDALQKLRSAAVSVLFSVDLFNEGVDIPEVDLVMFLRPTESITVFLQQLGRGLRLHHSKSHLTVLDFIGNYHKAHYKVALVAGKVEDEPENAGIREILAAFTRSTPLSDLPPGVELHFDLQVIDLMQQLLQRQEPWRERLIAAYLEVVESLGHPPTLLELQRWGRHPISQYLREFKRWSLFLKTQGALSPEALQLDAEVGDFLGEVERTQLTRAYKMVVLKTFVLAHGLEQPVTVQRLIEGFRHFFLESPRHARDLQGTEVEDIAAIPDERLRRYLEVNPLAAWTNPGTGNRRVYFAYDKTSGQLSYVGPKAHDTAAFAEAVLERVAYRLENHFAVRYERKNLFKVIQSGESGDRGIIHLGTDETAPIPRNQGWKAVLIGRHRLYAKFAKIAINVVKDHAVDGLEVPNRLTEVLEELFGPGGYRSEQMNKVRIRPAEGEQDVWVIEPASRTSQASE